MEPSNPTETHEPSTFEEWIEYRVAEYEDMERDRFANGYDAERFFGRP